jgi:hypothetical protein
MITNEILEQFKPWLISVAKVGSSILPWIDNPRDTDYLFVVDNNRLPKKSIELRKYQPSNECWLIVPLERSITMVGAYQYHWLEPIFGDIFPKYDIFEHIEEYKKTLVFRDLGKIFDPVFKHWYHTLTGIYLIENGKYELTEEQVTNVRLCHNRQMTQEIYDYMQEQLAKYAKELNL